MQMAKSALGIISSVLGSLVSQLPAPPASLRPPCSSCSSSSRDHCVLALLLRLFFFASISAPVSSSDLPLTGYASPPLLSHPPPYLPLCLPPHSASLPLALLCPDWSASLMLRSYITSLCHLPPSLPLFLRFWLLLATTSPTDRRGGGKERWGRWHEQEVWGEESGGAVEENKTALNVIFVFWLYVCSDFS